MNEEKLIQEIENEKNKLKRAVKEKYRKKMILLSKDSQNQYGYS